MLRLLPILLLIVFIGYTGAFHFYASPGERKCFQKELTKGTLLIGRYKLEIKDPDALDYNPPRDKVDTGTLIDVEEVFDSNHRVVHQRGRASGQFTFSTIESGEHRICITPKSFFKKKWLDGGGSNPNSMKDSKFERARITVDFLIGDGSILDSKHTTKVESLTQQVNVLNDKLIDIKREHEFIREKEASFRDLSERTCAHVLRWLVLNIIALCVVCIYQLFRVRKFFIKQKVA